MKNVIKKLRTVIKEKKKLIEDIDENLRKTTKLK